MNGLEGRENAWRLLWSQNLSRNFKKGKKKYN